MSKQMSEETYQAMGRNLGKGVLRAVLANGAKLALVLFLGHIGFLLACGIVVGAAVPYAWSVVPIHSRRLPMILLKVLLVVSLGWIINPAAMFVNFLRIFAHSVFRARAAGRAAQPAV